jgi:hypothetical protein
MLIIKAQNGEPPRWLILYTAEKNCQMVTTMAGDVKVGRHDRKCFESGPLTQVFLTV